jgi:UDP-N-acetylmuramate dehydrogenase
VFPLISQHSFGFSSFSQNIVTIESIDQLYSLSHDVKSSQYVTLGEGSNTVFLQDYPGTVVKIALKGVVFQQTDTHHCLQVAAGENWHDFVVLCLQRNIFGLENLASIPGTVGAAPIQNIGAYGVEVERFIQSVSYFCQRSEQMKTITHKECSFSYRDSIFKHRLSDQVIITQVTFSIPKAWTPVTSYGELKDLVKPSAQDIFNKVVAVRQAKLPDPKKLGNAGSFFKNPVIALESFELLKQKWPAIPSYRVNDSKVKIPAAWLIDTLGFKGKKIGGISCHANQPLVLTNDGTGTGQELLILAREIRNKVQQQFSIVLENEVRLIGQDGPVLL